MGHEQAKELLIHNLELLIEDIKKDNIGIESIKMKLPIDDRIGYRVKFTYPWDGYDFDLLVAKKFSDAIGGTEGSAS